MQLLQKLGYTYLTPKEIEEMRGGSHTRVLLEPILREQLGEINHIQVNTTRREKFTPQNIEAAIEAMRKPPLEDGYLKANEYVYNLLTLGKALEQSIDGDKKSYTIQYIDWEHPRHRTVYKRHPPRDNRM